MSTGNNWFGRRGEPTAQEVAAVAQYARMHGVNLEHLWLLDVLDGMVDHDTLPRMFALLAPVARTLGSIDVHDAHMAFVDAFVDALIEHVEYVEEVASL